MHGMTHSNHIMPPLQIAKVCECLGCEMGGEGRGREGHKVRVGRGGRGRARGAATGGRGK